MTPLTIAVSKGRIFTEALPLLAHAGVKPLEDPESSRKLILPTTREDVRLVLIRATDTPPYVEYGGADLGIAGRDVLMEYEGNGLYAPLDLRIARCRMMTAGYRDAPPPRGRMRVATKYVNTARAHYAAQGRQVEIIKLYGSMELAPIVGMADEIVDLVSTGNTLKANGLAPLEPIADISARLVVNRAAMKMKHAAVSALIDRIAEAVELRAQAA